MSQENVEVVRRGYEALNQLDIPAWLKDFHPDVEAHDLPGVPDATVARGHDDLHRWVEMMLEIWEDARYEPEKFTEAGQFVIVAVRAQARGRRSAVPMDVRMFHAFEIRDGKVQRMWCYLDEADALEAVGLRTDESQVPLDDVDLL